MDAQLARHAMILTSPRGDTCCFKRSYSVQNPVALLLISLSILSVSNDIPTVRGDIADSANADNGRSKGISSSHSSDYCAESKEVLHAMATNWTASESPRFGSIEFVSSFVESAPVNSRTCFVMKGAVNRQITGR